MSNHVVSRGEPDLRNGKEEIVTATGTWRRTGKKARTGTVARTWMGTGKGAWTTTEKRQNGNDNRDENGDDAGGGQIEPRTHQIM